MNAIFAVDEILGFGKNGMLPWYSSKDLVHFSATTKNSTLVMGRLTWDSLPHSKILQTRRCIIVSSLLEGVQARGVVVVASLEDAAKYSWADGNYATKYVIGGVQLLKQGVEQNLITKMIVTHIKGTHECDVYFKEFNELTADCSVEIETHTDEIAICTYVIQPLPFSPRD